MGAEARRLTSRSSSASVSARSSPVAARTSALVIGPAVARSRICHRSVYAQPQSSRRSQRAAEAVAGATALTALLEKSLIAQAMQALPRLPGVDEQEFPRPLVREQLAALRH